ncbi:MAG: dockerin type I domain-containing protein [Bryobacteraceae bacterium]|jgi:pimeloyl-ACP methyl ester carboxylesterase
MLPSIGFHKFGFGVLGLVLVFMLGVSAFPGSPAGGPDAYATSAARTAPKQTPQSAPPVTVDGVLPNLFYGTTAPGGANGPVLVFLHGLAGSYADWLESNNCPPSPTPCGPNGPGAGTGNDMYDYAYEAGFRTAFVSMNPDNSNNSATIQANAAMLETMFPRILANFGVSKVYFVCHSKGGLDLQAALATPQWIGIANAVFTLGTPNQGDALSNWLFLTPNGQALGQALGLLTPGVQALEIGNVQQFRRQWDPIFESAQIPFYTVAGDLCTEPKPSTACNNTVTGPILQSITGGTKAPPNDQLVTEPETYLPTSYAMNLGVELVNHYQLRLGDNSFNMIYSRVMAQENQQNGQPGLTRIATNGFGDQANSEAWSMAWFTNAVGQSQLYVGTGREVYCVTSALAAIEAGLPGLYPPAIGGCTPDYHLLPLRAEIWQYTPQTNTWLRVFQSPNSLTTTSNTGAAVATAREMGIRSLTVVNEPGGVTALYAGTVTSGAIFETNHTVGGWPPPRILRSTDGVTWTALPQDPGTFLGNISTAAESDQQFQNFGFRSGGQLNGILYMQVGNFSGVGRVIASKPGTNPNGGNDNYQFVSPPTEVLPVWILQSFNGFMYAATGNPYNAAGSPTEYGVWKTDGLGTAPYTWTPIIAENAGYSQQQPLAPNYALSMQIFSDTAPGGCPATSGVVTGGAGGCLYVGTDEPSELVRIHPDTTGQVPVNNADGSLDTVDSWDLVVGNPRTIPPPNPGAGNAVLPISGIGQYFDNGFTGHFWRMGVGGMGLYMSTYDWSAEHSNQNGFAANWAQEFGTDLFRTPDGIHWTAVSRIGLGDGMNTGGRTFGQTPFGLYWGTARPAVGGTQVYMIDNSVLDLNKDGVIDMKDVNLMQARLNAKAMPNDPMDVNQDGKITSADVQMLMTQCTYPKCAVPAVRPAAATLGAPVLHSAPGIVNGTVPSTVSLDWPTVSGAQDYLVYRINMSPNDTTPPPIFGPLAAACGTNAAVAALPLCSSAKTTQPATSTSTPFGYPGAVVFITRVTASGPTATFSETSPSTLQVLYFVRSEDANGNLSAPSNLVGGPSLAAQ